jgi:hypothetical protein
LRNAKQKLTEQLGPGHGVCNRDAVPDLNFTRKSKEKRKEKWRMKFKSQFAMSSRAKY